MLALIFNTFIIIIILFLFLVTICSSVAVLIGMSHFCWVSFCFFAFSSHFCRFFFCFANCKRRTHFRFNIILLKHLIGLRKDSIVFDVIIFISLCLSLSHDSKPLWSHIRINITKHVASSPANGKRQTNLNIISNKHTQLARTQRRIGNSYEFL